MSFGKPKDEKDLGPAPIHPIRPSISNPSSGRAEAFLGSGSKVVGSLTFAGPVELDGYIEGEVHAQDMLTIGEAAIINAKVTGTEILIKGTVTGDIIASKKLSLRKPAKIVGNISCSSISVEEGVIFEGKCAMGASTGKIESSSTLKTSVSA